MNLFITGIAGFIGSHLAEKLHDLGHHVSGVDNLNKYYSTDQKKDNLSTLTKKGIHVFTESIEHKSWENELRNIDVIFHFAAQPGISTTTSFEDYFTNNIVATRTLLNSIMKLQKRPFFVNIATSSVYGKYATESEITAPAPTSDYGVTKLAAEQMVMAFQRGQKINATSLRLYSVFGPRERPEKLYPKLIYAILNDKPFPLFEGSREHSRSFTFVDDIVQGVVKVLSHLDACNGEIFNIGSDIEITTGYAIDTIERLMNKKAKIEIQPKRQGDQARTFANIEKARRILDYNPVTKPEDGFVKEIEWMKSCLARGIKIYSEM